MCSGLKHLFDIYIYRACLNSSRAGIHSVFETLSVAFELTFHSVSSSIVKPIA